MKVAISLNAPLGAARLLLTLLLLSACLLHSAAPVLADDEPMTEELDIKRGRPGPKPPLRISSIVHGIGNQTTDVSDAFALFSRSGSPLGSLELNHNYPEFSGSVPASSQPLAVSIVASEGGMIYGQTVELTGLSDSGSEMQITICLPRVTLDSLDPVETFYFDVEGTPYFDSGRQQRATNESCAQSILRGFRPRRIGYLSTNSYSDLLFAQGRFWRGANSLGQLDMATGYFFGVQNDVPDSGHALSLEISAIQQGVIPAQTIYVESNNGSSLVTLCVPESQIDEDWNSARYCFDSQGTPYHDATLKVRAINTTCPSLLSRGLRFKALVNASANFTSTLPGAEIEFTSGAQLLGLLNLEDNIYEWNGVIANSTLHATKVVIRANQYGSMPQLRIALFGLSSSFVWVEQEYCFPRITTQSEAVYYLDRFGGVYSDALLSSQIICNPPRDPEEELTME